MKKQTTRDKIEEGFTPDQAEGYEHDFSSSAHPENMSKHLTNLVAAFNGEWGPDQQIIPYGDVDKIIFYEDESKWEVINTLSMHYRGIDSIVFVYSDGDCLEYPIEEGIVTEISGD